MPPAQLLAAFARAARVSPAPDQKTCVPTQNDAALAQLQRSIEVLSTSLEGAEVDLPPEELEAVSAQETAVRGFLQECTANPQMHDIAAKCERLENRLSHVFVRLTFFISIAIGKRLREQPDTQGR